MRPPEGARVRVDGALGTLDGYPTPLGHGRRYAFVVMDATPWLLRRVPIDELVLA